MLMMLRSDPRRDNDLVLVVPLLTLGQYIGIDDPRRLDLQLDGPSEIEREIKAVLVVGDGTDGTDDQLAIPGDVSAVVTEVGVFV